MEEINIINHFELTSQNDVYNLGTYFLVAEKLLKEELSKNEIKVLIEPDTKLVFIFNLDPKFPNVKLSLPKSVTNKVSEFVYVARKVNSILKTIYLSDSVNLDKIPKDTIEEVNSMLDKSIETINNEEIIKTLIVQLTYKLHKNIRRETIQEMIKNFKKNK